eukprot:6347776-Amphidinium_carterae.1
MILTDASPWGVGAVLASEGTILAWFHSRLSEFEIQYLSIVVGDAASQQTLECLALLVALRFWHTQWAQSRVHLTVRADNYAALYLLAKMTARSVPINRIARELALELATGCYRPNIIEHLPGVLNTLADYASRVHAPE